MYLKQYRAFYSVQCRRTYSDTWNMSCIFMSVIFSAPDHGPHGWARLCGTPPDSAAEDRSTWRALRPTAGYAQQWV